MSNRKRHYVYIVQCADGTLYTGYSTDVAKRIKVHNAGRGAKYTRPRLPCVLVWESRPWDDRRSALTLERAIKRESREAKIAMIKTRPFPQTGAVNHSFKLKA